VAKPKESIREWLLSHWDGHERDALIAECVRVFGCSRETATGKYRMVIRGGNRAAQAAPVPAGRRTMDDFRKQYDVPYKIREGVKKHLDGCYLTDQEFREACGVHVNVWRRHADSDEFREYQGRFSGTLYWAQTRMMSEMKHIAGIPVEV
jgi:hypothetical protein